MQERIENTLIDLGLTRNEVLIYLANLKLGSSRVEEISRKAGILRTTAYDVLDSMVRKGFSASVIKSGVRYYSVTEPRQIIGLLDEKKKKVEEIMEDLEGMKKSVIAKPKMQMFEGKDGLKSVYSDILSTGKDLMGYGNAELSMKVLTYFLPTFIKGRVKIGMRSRLIVERSETGIEFKKTDKSQKRETRFLDSTKSMETIFYIYGDKVAILTFVSKEPIAIIIENKEIADSQRILFENMWKMAS
ncbi:MAG: hypothetical protein A2787_10225 [Omnitrophica WOR_2 bacterium RIFCSPHIGHO2_01_FULL_48_9]|nr:MAG: hypothetical protein A2787_10225 [Omnitrophica WOR_2 bacterium RIFCSPHIGHO2_01_FULL_48_9]